MKEKPPGCQAVRFFKWDNSGAIIFLIFPFSLRGKPRWVYCTRLKVTDSVISVPIASVLQRPST